MTWQFGSLLYRAQRNDRNVSARVRNDLYYIHFAITFNRTVDEVIHNTTAGFRSAMNTTSDANRLDIDIVNTHIMTAIEKFNQNDSNWLFDHLIKASVGIGAYRPLQGSTYVVTKRTNY